MSLPNPGQDAVPFTPLTAEFYDDTIENVEALAEGTGLDDGAVTHDKVATGYKFSVYRNGAQSLPGSSTNTKIQFDTEEYDTGSNFDSTTNYRFTAPVSRYYRFSASVGVLTSGNWIFNIVLRKNGTVYKALAQGKTNGGNTILNGSATISLAANDYVEVFCFSNDTGANNINVGQANTWFTGELIL